MTTLELRVDAAITAGNRAQLYSLVAAAFRFPSSAFLDSVQSGGFRAAVEAAASRLPYPLEIAGPLGQGTTLDEAAFVQEYMAHFDVGGPSGPPCTLYEGEIGGGRLKVIEEVLRLYHYFGLQLADENGKRERPDHLALELEFLHALTTKEAELIERGLDPSAYRRAQRDFLRFHVADLVEQVQAMVAPRGIPFYSDLVALASAFCQAEQAHLSGL